MAEARVENSLRAGGTLELRPGWVAVLGPSSGRVRVVVGRALHGAVRVFLASGGGSGPTGRPNW